jgi:hypothetical protein
VVITGIVYVLLAQLDAKSLSKFGFAGTLSAPITLFVCYKTEAPFAWWAFTIVDYVAIAVLWLNQSTGAKKTATRK